MALPEDYNPRNHLINQVTLWHNKQVAKYFKNQKVDDITTPKASLRVACTITPNDTDFMILQRQWLFEITAGHAQSLQTPIMGIPVQEYQRNSRYSPQVKMHFKEIYNYEKHSVQGLNQVLGEIGFRLPNKSSETIGRADAVIYANRIKEFFITENTVWHKGHFKATYLDIDNGLDLRLFCLNKAAGQNIARMTCHVAGITYDETMFEFKENSKNFPSNPGTQRVYGQLAKKPVERPIADLKITHAQLLVNGRVPPINLLSVGMRLKSAILYI